MTRRRAVMRRKKPVIWFLVADARQAKIYKHAQVVKNGKAQQELVPLLDKPFRMRSIKECNIHENAETSFVHCIAKRLHEANAQKEFDKLVFIAPSKVLGELRKSLDTCVVRKIVAELAEELTHCNGRQLKKILTK